MKQIPLTKGKFALIDDKDYERLSKYKWQFAEGGFTEQGYANRSRSDNKGKVWMHLEVMGKIPRGYFVDHKNGNRLDNRRCNLRIASRILNNINRGMFKNNKLGFKGVYKDGNRYMAYIGANCKRIPLGRFDTLEEAIKARKKAERYYFTKALITESIKLKFINLAYTFK